MDKEKTKRKMMLLWPKTKKIIDRLHYKKRKARIEIVHDAVVDYSKKK
tara:strand:- start:13066 stop:13209 length:144 start_codon:yes stop_codon:yes gene_type:complete